MLAGHPEARSLLSEASHWRGLAAHSAVLAAAASQGANLARLRYEESHHRLDPRGHRRTRYEVACALVASAWLDITLRNSRFRVRGDTGQAVKLLLRSPAVGAMRVCRARLVVVVDIHLAGDRGPSWFGAAAGSVHGEDIPLTGNAFEALLAMGPQVDG